MNITDPGSGKIVAVTPLALGESLLPALLADLDRDKPPPTPSQGLIQRSFRLTATYRRDKHGQYHVLGVQAIPLTTKPA